MSNPWAEERKARLEKHAEFVREVARELGLQVREYGKDEYGFRTPDIVTPEGVLIEVGEVGATGAKRRRVYPHGWPREAKIGEGRSSQLVPKDVGEENPAIGVGGDKTPAQVARDIQRRVLPEVARIYAKLAERARETEATVNTARGVYRQMCEVLGITAELCAYGEVLSASLYGVVPGSYGEVTVSYGGSVDIHARGLTPEVAEKVLRALKGEEVGK